MSNLEVYFPNHQKALRFPWSLYHLPLLQDLEKKLSVLKAGQEVLVIGPGAFQELEMLISKGVKVSILDIDPRVVEIHRELNSKDISNFYLVDENFNGYPQDVKFDLIYAKEVIEHIVEYDRFLAILNTSLLPKGSIWLSTPDYGFFLLPFLEDTVLELIARFSGFSRKNIHPSKFSSRTLREAVEKAGFNNVVIAEMPMRFALTVTGTRD